MTTAPVQLVDIDLITSDFLHLASLRQAMELFTIPSVPAETTPAIQGAQASKRPIKLLNTTVDDQHIRAASPPLHPHLRRRKASPQTRYFLSGFLCVLWLSANLVIQSF